MDVLDHLDELLCGDWALHGDVEFEVYGDPGGNGYVVEYGVSGRDSLRSREFASAAEVVAFYNEEIKPRHDRRPVGVAGPAPAGEKKRLAAADADVSIGDGTWAVDVSALTGCFPRSRPGEQLYAGRSGAGERVRGSVPREARRPDTWRGVDPGERFEDHITDMLATAHLYAVTAAEEGAAGATAPDVFFDIVDELDG